MTQRRALFWMVSCLLLAAVLRLPALPQFPPGLHYDEAANAILAGDIGWRGARPIFISSYTGKEVLFFYLAGSMVRLVGESVFSLRLTAAFVGLLAVAAAYRVGRELLRDRRVALLAAALLAVSFWHLLISRLGFRVNTQPLLQALTVAALWRGLRLAETQPASARTWGMFVLGGVFLGLAGYTYLAVRLFPVLLGLALLPVLRQRWRQLLLSGSVAGLVLLPLLNYFRLHPDAFWVRIQQVGNSDGLTLGQSLLKSLGMFFVRGDPYWRFNLPERPLFSWPGGALLLAGAALLFWQWRRRRGWRRAAAALLLLAPLIMLLPTALATNEIVPSNLRAIGMLPFVYLLPAFSLAALLDHLPIRLPDRAFDFLLLLLLLIGGGLTYHAYFQQWGQRADLFYENDADLVAVAAYIDATAQPEETTFVAALHYRHPTVAFLSQQYERIKWLPGSAALVFPATAPARVIYPHSSPMPAWAAPLLADAAMAPGPSGPDGQPVYTAYTLSATPSLPIPHPLAVNFGNAITLLGYDVGAAAEAALPVTLFWQAQGAPPQAFAPFVHLEDAWGHRWSQVELDAYPSEQWAAGDRIVQRVNVPLPAGAPPGQYGLRVGLFNQESGERLPNLDGEGRYAGSAALLPPAPIPASPPPPTLPSPPFPTNQSVAPGLTLLGYERGSAAAQSGEQLQLAFWWLANAPLPSGWELRLMLTDLNRQAWTLQQGQPVHDSYPFTQWPSPLFLIDRQTVILPSDLPTGDYELAMQLLDSRGATLFSQSLGPLRVTAADRLFQPPPIAQQLDARLGDEIGLLGYNLDGENLTLVWHTKRIFEYYAPLDRVYAAIDDGAALGVFGAPLLDRSVDDTIRWLETQAPHYQRIWLLRSGNHIRIDPEGKMESWMDEHFILMRDVTFFSQSSLHAKLYLPTIPVFENAQPPIAQPVLAQFGEQIRLIGYAADPPQVADLPSQTRLYWEVASKPDRHYRYIWRRLVRGADGALHELGVVEREPYEGDAATTYWDPGKTIMEYIEMPPLSAAPVEGEHFYALALYDAETLEKLPVTAIEGGEIAADGVTALFPMETP